MASHEVTDLLRAWSAGNAPAADKLFALVYEDLRRQALRQLRGERRDQTLRPTALLHEAFLRLVEQEPPVWQNRIQFFALAAQAMRRVLIDHARARGARKRAGGWQRISLDEQVAVEGPRELDLVALNAALEKLSAFDQDKARLVELRFFGGLTTEEAAQVLGVSVSTVARQWRLAKTWLYRCLERADAL